MQLWTLTAKRAAKKYNDKLHDVFETAIDKLQKLSHFCAYIFPFTTILHRQKDGGCEFYQWQYLSNLTQAIRHKESNIFAIFIPDAKLEDFGTFPYVFIWALERFLCNTNQLWVIIAISIFFPMQDLFARQIKKNVPMYFGRLLDCLLYNRTREWKGYWPWLFKSYRKSILQV